MSTAATTASAPDGPPDLLLIGGSGLLGRTVLEVVADRPGFRVHATGLRRPFGGTATWHRVDLGDGGVEAGRLITRLRPAAIIHAAAVTSGPDLRAITGRAPGPIAAAGASVGARLVHLSSDVVFGGHPEHAFVESDPVDPVHAYGEAKAEAEAAVAEADPGAVIVRTSLLWRGDHGPQLDLVADAGVTFFTDEVRCPLRADRLAVACLELTTRPDIAGPLHVAGADPVDRLEFARALAPLVGRRPTDLRGGRSDPGVRRPRRLVLDSTRARSLLSAPLPGIAADGPAREARDR